MPVPLYSATCLNNAKPIPISQPYTYHVDCYLICKVSFSVIPVSPAQRFGLAMDMQLNRK
jgi:hypothetical protein